MASFCRTSDLPFMAAMTFLLLGLPISFFCKTGAQCIGVCYGGNGNADNLPPENEVVSLYKAYGIGRMRIYAPYPEILQNLRGSGIEILVGVSNDNIQALASAPFASDWVQRNIKDYWPDVKFKYIAVGNEINGSDPRAKFILPAMQNIYNEIAASNLQSQIKVSVAIDTNLLGVFDPPSAGVFKESERSYMESIISFLVQIEAPLLANIYPYFRVVYNSQPVSYALFTEQNVVVRDGQYSYKNLFDALMDALYSALEKAGGSSLKIVVSESGWPSAGGTVETIENAGTYYRNLIDHVKGGTPRRSGQAIETYLFSMFDENRKEPEIERHFGLFLPDKQPKYNIVFK